MLLSWQYPFLVAVDHAMEAEAAKEGIDLVAFDPRQSVTEERRQVENLIEKKLI